MMIFQKERSETSNKNLFQFSKGQFEKFKKHLNLHILKLINEANGVNTKAAINYTEQLRNDCWRRLHTKANM